MRTFIVPLFFAAVSTGCAPQQGPFFISSVTKFPTNCEYPKSTSGSTSPTPLFSEPLTIDVRADPSYTVAAEISGADDFASTSAQPPVQVGGRTLSPGAKEHGIIQKVVLRYAFKTDGASGPAIRGITPNVTQDTYPLGGVVTPKMVVPVDLFGPLIRSKFADDGVVIPSNGELYPLRVSFEVHGVLDQSQTPWHTQAYSVDLTYVKSEVTCPAPGDQRFVRFQNASQTCFSQGVGRRIGQTDCCGLTPETVDGRPGCDIRLR